MFLLRCHAMASETMLTESADRLVVGHITPDVLPEAEGGTPGADALWATITAL